MIPAPRRGDLLCLLLLLSLVSDPGAAQEGAREAMADTMARMMEAMGLFDSAPARRMGGGPPPDPMSISSPFGPPGWTSAFGEGSGAWPMPWRSSRLEGVWEGRNGEILIVQGDRFRIYSPEMRRLDGLIRIQGERLALYNPVDAHAQSFEFAESRGRLILRDLAGQDYLYRRLRLDGGERPVAVPSPSAP